MHLKIISPPPFAPVTLAEVYEHMRWDTEEAGSPLETVYPLETTITRNILTATSAVERHTHRSLVLRTLQALFPYFPTMGMTYRRRLNSHDGGAAVSGGLWIELPRPPLVQVLAVQYYDASNALITVDPSSYFVTEAAAVPRLQFVEGFSAPATYLRDDAVAVTYEAGYAPEGSPVETQDQYTANIPSELRDAVLMQVQLLSDRFDATERNAIERARDWLMETYVVRSL